MSSTRLEWKLGPNNVMEVSVDGNESIIRYHGVDWAANGGRGVGYSGGKQAFADFRCNGGKHGMPASISNDVEILVLQAQRLQNSLKWDAPGEEICMEAEVSGACISYYGDDYGDIINGGEFCAGEQSIEDFLANGGKHGMPNRVEALIRSRLAELTLFPQ